MSERTNNMYVTNQNCKLWLECLKIWEETGKHPEITNGIVSEVWYNWTFAGDYKDYKIVQPRPYSLQKLCQMMENGTIITKQNSDQYRIVSLTKKQIKLSWQNSQGMEYTGDYENIEDICKEFDLYE